LRLDKFIYEKFELRSRSYAENLIKTGAVIINGKPCLKASCEALQTDNIEIIDENYASQGAYKLEKAFSGFGLDVNGKTCADIGCSNGGFTDCLLRHGAEKVVAVDVAECALSDELLSSGRVEFIRANARELPSSLFDFDFACTDVSFISLKLVLPELFRILRKGGECVALVKPQFEVGKKALNKNGIVKDKKDGEKALSDIIRFAENLGFKTLGSCVSPVRFESKNIEYLLYLKKPA